MCGLDFDQRPSLPHTDGVEAPLVLSVFAKDFFFAQELKQRSQSSPLLVRLLTQKLSSKITSRAHLQNATVALKDRAAPRASRLLEHMHAHTRARAHITYLLTVLADIGVDLVEGTQHVEVSVVEPRLFRQIGVHVLVADSRQPVDVGVVPGEAAAGQQEPLHARRHRQKAALSLFITATATPQKL